MKIYISLSKHASIKKIVSLLIVTNTIYITMLMFSIPRVMQYSGGLYIFDMIPTGYTLEYARKLLETLGTVGRDVYLFRQIPFDTLYPGLFAITYSLVLIAIFRVIFTSKSRLQYVALLPLLSGIFDYLENTGIILMITSYPTLNPTLVAITSLFSILKTINTSIVFVLILLGFLTIGVRKLLRK